MGLYVCIKIHSNWIHRIYIIAFISHLPLIIFPWNLTQKNRHLVWFTTIHLNSNYGDKMQEPTTGSIWQFCLQPPGRQTSAPWPSRIPPPLMVSPSRCRNVIQLLSEYALRSFTAFSVPLISTEGEILFWQGPSKDTSPSRNSPFGITNHDLPGKEHAAFQASKNACKEIREWGF